MFKALSVCKVKKKVLRLPGTFQPMQLGASMASSSSSSSSPPPPSAPYSLPKAEVVLGMLLVRSFSH